MIAKTSLVPAGFTEYADGSGAVASPRRSTRSHCFGALFICVATLASGCGPSAAEQKAQIDLVQKKADEHLAQVEKQYKDQLAAAQKNLDDVQKKLADSTEQAKAEAKAEADEELSKAHAEADKLAADAAKALARARTAYKDLERHDLAALSKEMDELRVKAAKAPAKTKPQIDKAMKDLVAKRTAVAKEIPQIDTATVETLRAAKAKVDQKLAVLKHAINALRAKLG